MNQKVKLGACTAALLVGVSSVALGANTNEASGFSWTGLYFAAGGGYGGVSHNVGFEVWDYSPGGVFSFGDFPADYPEGVDVFSIGATFDFGGLGDFGTFGTGYDVQISNRLVIGVFGDVDLSRINSNATVFGDVCYEDAGGPDDCDDDPITISDSLEANIDFTLSPVWSVGGRAGFLANPQTLIYGLAAYSRAVLSVTPSFDSLETGPSSLEPTRLPFNAFTFGFGVETLLTPHFSAKLEYRGTVWSVDETIGDPDVSGYRIFTDSYVQTIRGTLAYRLGSHPLPDGYDGAFSDGPTSWSGLHFGVGGGFGIVNHNAGLELFDYTPGGLYSAGGFGGFPDGFDAFSTGAAVDFGGRGPIGAVEAGLDIQMGNRLVVGVFADFTHAAINTNINFFGEVCYEDAGGPDDCDIDPIVVSDAPEVDLNVLTGNMWTVGARAGLLASPGTLIYALAGYTHLDMVASASVTSLFTSGTELDPFAFEMNTLTLGVGFETALSSNLTAKLEYRATVVSMESVFEPVPDLGVRFFDTSVVQTVRGGLSWRFGNN